MIRACIFDADGTLLDSMPAWNHLASEYLQSISIEADSSVDAAVSDMTLEESASWLKAKYHLQKTTDDIKSEILAMLQKYYESEVQLKPCVKKTLAFLSHHNIPMAVVSTNDLSLLTAAFRRNGILPYFSFILTASQLHTSKETPDLYLNASRLLHASPSETAVFEDTLLPLQTAHAWGLFTIAVYDASSNKDWQHMIETADYSIRTFSEIPDLILK